MSEMNYYRPDMHPAKQEYIRFMGDLHAQLENAYLEEEKQTGLKKMDVAQKLNFHKSYVSRLLNGTSNMTFRTLVYLAWALGCRPIVKLEKHKPRSITSNHFSVENKHSSAPNHPVVKSISTHGMSIHDHYSSMYETAA